MSRSIGQKLPTRITYGYPWYAYQDVLTTLHQSGWVAGYYNFARSGFTTEQILNGDGKDACDGAYTANGGTTSPLADATAILAAHKGSWNRVLITGGINNTNWGDVLGRIGLHSAVLSPSVLTPAVVYPGTNPFYTATNCQADLDDWDGWNVGSLKSRTTFIQDVHDIASALNGADQTARVLWVEYYNIAGAGNIGFGSPAPTACKDPMQSAMQALQQQIELGLQGTTAQPAPVHIGGGAILGYFGSDVQPWYPDDTFTKLLQGVPGWPHPNSDGAKGIAAGLILH